MQTFVPFTHHWQTAQVLDTKRLGKQRVENLQIAKAILDPTYGWQNHPAVNMWRPYLDQLYLYHIWICGEWVVTRGFEDTTMQSFRDLVGPIVPGAGPEPDWWGGPIHRSHQSNLIRKDPKYYGPIWPATPSDIPYVWPYRKDLP